MFGFVLGMNVLSYPNLMDTSAFNLRIARRYVYIIRFYHECDDSTILFDDYKACLVMPNGDYNGLLFFFPILRQIIY